MKTILIADDNPAICHILSQYGKKEGYRVLTARDGQEALALFEKHVISVILLDIMMPGINGVELCRRIRRTSDVPILMVTARTSDRDRIAGLDEGADDYIVKPFSPGEVMARIRAVLRRADKNAANDHRLSRGSLYLHLEKNEAAIGKEPLSLTKKEAELLWTLASNPGRIYTRETLLDLVWGYAAESNDRAVDSCIKRLRAKLDAFSHPDFTIKTVWGAGYQFEYKAGDHDEA